MSQSLAQRIGNRIKALRGEKGWTQFQLADKCGRGEDAISALERGVSTPHLETLKQIAGTFGIRLVDLLPPEPPGETDALLAELIDAARDLDQATLKIVLAQVKALKPGV
jgi:transcriptional regulator with XRE-family HTH domain